MLKLPLPSLIATSLTTLLNVNVTLPVAFSLRETLTTTVSPTETFKTPTVNSGLTLVMLVTLPVLLLSVTFPEVELLSVALPVEALVLLVGDSTSITLNETVFTLALKLSSPANLTTTE